MKEAVLVKSSFGLSIVAVAIGCAALASAEGGVIHHLDRVVRATNEQGGSCTAFPVGPGLYLTAKHCMLSNPVVKVGDEVVVEAYLHPSIEVDVALLRTAPDNDPLTKNAPKPLRFARAAPKPGDRLYCPSFALGHYKRLLDGYAGDDPGAMSIPVVPGCSGAPILNESGRVVGIASRVKREELSWAPTHVSWFVPYEAFKDWLTPLLERL